MNIPEIVEKINDWNYRKKSFKHDQFKREISAVETEISYSKITKAPYWVIKKAEERLARLQKRLVKNYVIK